MCVYVGCFDSILHMANVKRIYTESPVNSSVLEQNGSKWFVWEQQTIDQVHSSDTEADLNRIIGARTNTWNIFF